MEQIQDWRDTILAKYSAKPENQPLTESELIHLNDWFESPDARRYLTRLHRFSVSMVLDLAKQWSKTISQYNSHLETSEDTLEILSCGEGYKWVRLLSDNSYLREGNLMGHCVGTYKNIKTSEIYSLRDPKNLPHCTLEISHLNKLHGFHLFLIGKSRDEEEQDDSKKKIIQISGKANTLVKPKYQEYLKEFIEFFHQQEVDFKANSSLYSRYNWMFSDNKVSALNEVREFIGNLNLSQSSCTFGDTLRVKGDCNFHNFKGKLPQYLEVEGNLNLSYFYGEMPETLIVKGNLDFTNSGTKHLSKELTVTGTLKLSEEKTLPENWTYGNLDTVDSFISFNFEFRSGFNIIGQNEQSRSRVNRPRQSHNNRPIFIFESDFHAMDSRFSAFFERKGLSLGDNKKVAHRPYLRVKKEQNKEALSFGDFKPSDQMSEATQKRGNLIHHLETTYSNENLSAWNIFENCFRPEYQVPTLLQQKNDSVNQFNLRPYQQAALSKFNR